MKKYVYLTYFSFARRKQEHSWSDVTVTRTKVNSRAMDQYKDAPLSFISSLQKYINMIFKGMRAPNWEECLIFDKVSVGTLVFEGLIIFQGNRVRRKFAYLHEDENSKDAQNNPAFDTASETSM